MKQEYHYEVRYLDRSRPREVFIFHGFFLKKELAMQRAKKMQTEDGSDKSWQVVKVSKELIWEHK